MPRKQFSAGGSRAMVYGAEMAKAGSTGSFSQPGIYRVISGRCGASFFKKDFTNEAQLYII
ncbi:hypothetical protein [Faecalibacterium sp. An122]|uniref:hypothetical protein n=1 Tax=Faecalibacterium sp. An122 TaxID=1965551 RepID=UPI00117A9227|nr:hypothetical protein [Faecalibacterium sp. An122]